MVASRLSRPKIVTRRVRWGIADAFTDHVNPLTPGHYFCRWSKAAGRQVVTTDLTRPAGEGSHPRDLKATHWVADPGETLIMTGSVSVSTLERLVSLVSASWSSSGVSE